MAEENVLILVQREPEAEGLELPAYMTAGASGMDLRAAVNDPLEIPPGEVRLVTTGLRLAIPPGYEGQVRPRSGLALRHQITLLNAPGTIDSDYRGVVQVILFNAGRKTFVCERGERIAQLVIAPVARAELRVQEQLPTTGRDDGGFGHTGR